MRPLGLRIFPPTAAMARGTAALRCTVRVANLPEPVTAVLPCRLVLANGDTMELVTRLSSQLPWGKSSSRSRRV